MEPTFVHLNVHSEYSLVDGIVRFKSLVEAVAEAGMPAVAISDQSNLFGMVKFYKAAMGAGIKPIIGVDLWIADKEAPGQESRLLLLCRNGVGYRNLTRLVSLSYTEGQERGRAVVRREWLAGNCQGLLALSGGRQGDIGTALLAGNRELALERATEWIRHFGDGFYLEFQRTGRDGEEEYIHQAVELATTLDLPVVATNGVCFIKAEDFDAHEARVCIQDSRTLDDPRRPRHYSEEQYLRTPEEMAELFADIPEALENSVEIARRCNVEVTLGDYYLPDFPIPEGMTADEYTIQLSREGLEGRLERLYDTGGDDFPAVRKPYDERLAVELKVIIDMGFPGYFLIVADFIGWAKENNIPVGPGRGSGAGSLVAYSLGITDIDPLAYELLFERFLNPERVSMPDFDIDFCMEGRDRVIDYVAERYGREKVSQIITYGSMAAKAVIRDVGRVLGKGYGYVDQIAKMIPFEVGITLEKAMEQEPLLKERYERDEEVSELIDMAQKLEGIARNAGKHAGGVVIAPTELTDFAPLYCEEGGESVVTQFDKNDVESVGLVKFDLLGLRTLTIIDWTIDNIRQSVQMRGGDVDLEVPSIDAIPLDDPTSYHLLKKCGTTAVFQLESRGMKDLIKRLQPDCFEEIIALVALFRPGPLQSGMVDNFINRKHGREKISYPDAQYQHLSLKETLEPTYGIILYQEQVMQIARVLAGYTLGGADLLRRAMGKKNPAEMARQRDIFAEGAKQNNIDPELASRIFDLVEKFAGYGFNKSHSACYALVSYQTLWLKAHYTAEFMAAVLSADMDHTDKIVTLIDECLDMGLKVNGPSINQSCHRFAVNGEGAVVYGLGAIKGVGEAAIEGVLAERDRGGPYRDLFEMCQRIDLKRANRRVMESLIRSGAVDELGPNRATLLEALPQALKMAEQQIQNRKVGVVDMFGFAPQGEGRENHYDEKPEWPVELKLSYEKETLGLYLTGHPIIRYLPELTHFTSSRIVDLKPEGGKGVVVAGLIVSLRTLFTKRGDKIAFVTLDDRSARVEITLFSEAYARYRDIMVKDRVVVVEGEVSSDDYSGSNKISATHLYDIDHAREHFGKQIRLNLSHNNRCINLLDKLEHLLQPHLAGSCPVTVSYRNPNAEAQIDLGGKWRVKPTDELLLKLRQMIGDKGVDMEY